MKKIIEINGVKLEIDLREAVAIENYKVGTNVKVLIKQYNSDYKSFPGVIVGFDNFQALPTIIIAYLDNTYSNADLKFVYLNAKNTEVEICPSDVDVNFLRTDVIEIFDREIEKAEVALKTIRDKKGYFMKYFDKSFNAEVKQ